ncbi:hypothetical protein [Actinomadura litoris]|uniref:hypothetical protein n=1 Tax=Actinomadura litoris TaxID=2678616 RepID=UPI001FA771B2|nr:hypothetical protein [Actinomadura litoris]
MYSMAGSVTVAPPMFSPRTRADAWPPHAHQAPSPAQSPRPGVSAFLPVPVPAQVHAARAHLTPAYATGVDAVMWGDRRHPIPDRAAIGVVISASQAAQAGTGAPPEPLEVAAALVLLEAVRLEMDQTEARLLNTAQAAAMEWGRSPRSWAWTSRRPKSGTGNSSPGWMSRSPPSRCRSRRALNWDRSAHAPLWDQADATTGQGLPTPRPPQHPR